MNIEKIMRKLDEFFDLPKKKQNKKQDKLLKIIHTLEENKSELKKEMIIEGEKDETSDKYHDLCKELEVISKLIKKAKKQLRPHDEENTE